MRPRYRTWMFVGCLAAVLAPSAPALALESENASTQLRGLIDISREELARVRKYLAEVDAWLRQYSGSSFRVDTSYPFADLKRSATELARLANDVMDLISPCGDDSRRVGLDLRKRTQQLLRSVNRIGASGSPSLARMALGNAEHDIKATERQLQVVGQVTGCARGKDRDDDEEDDPADPDSTKSAHAARLEVGSAERGSSRYHGYSFPS